MVLEETFTTSSFAYQSSYFMPEQQSILYLHHPKAKLHNRVLIIARQLMHSLLNIFKIKKSTS
jgi:hypothetical protein